MFAQKQQHAMCTRRYLNWVLRAVSLCSSTYSVGTCDLPIMLVVFVHPKHHWFREPAQ